MHYTELHDQSAIDNINVLENCVIAKIVLSFYLPENNGK
jgi:hypothetical protein